MLANQLFDGENRVYVEKGRDNAIGALRAAGFEALLQLCRFAIEAVHQINTHPFRCRANKVLHGQGDAAVAFDSELFLQAEGQQFVLKKVRSHDVNNWKRSVVVLVRHGRHRLSSISWWGRTDQMLARVSPTSVKMKNRSDAVT